jgi:hypothetical protein
MTSAHAQPPSRNSKGPRAICHAWQTGTALFLGLSILVTSSQATAAPDTCSHPNPRYCELTKKGNEAMDAQRYEEAIQAYEEAYHVAKTPLLLFNLGRAYENLGKFPKAFDYLQQFKSEAPAKIRDQVPGLADLMADLQKRITTLTVSSNVRGARILIRNQQVGTTPLKAPIRLNSGSVTIEVIADGYQTYQKQVELPGGKKFHLEANITKKFGTLHIQSNFPNSVIWIDGTKVGNTPLETQTAPGTHSILATHPQASDYKTTTIVEAGKQKRLQLQLSKRVESKPITTKWWFWTGIGVVVVGASVAITIALTTEKKPSSGTIPPGSLQPLGFRF